MFRSAIVKLTAVCNIDCSYCYMFSQADQTFRRVPPRMRLDTALQVLDRICDFHPAGEPEPFSIVLHGGEPMLWPEASFMVFLEEVSRKRAQGWNLDIAVQTNLVLAPAPALLDAFREHRVCLDISLDGPRDINDAVRVDRIGRGTYDRVMANVERMRRQGHGDLIGGFLAVANPEMRPAEFLDWLQSLPVTRADVLWPVEFNWRHPPWSLGATHAYACKPHYGQWFADLFDAWWQRDEPGLNIRLFSRVVELALGGHAPIGALVNDSRHMFVVNTDGGYEYPDYLRESPDGAARTPFDAHTHGIDLLVVDPLFARLLNLREQLPVKCATCRHELLCGGGVLPGRSAPAQGCGARESVLCADQMYFLERALRTVQNTLQQRPQHTHVPEPSLVSDHETT